MSECTERVEQELWHNISISLSFKEVDHPGKTGLK